MSERPKGFVTATHSVLFEEEQSHCCDVCSAPVEADDEDEDDGQVASGRGLLVWARGDERRYQEPLLCSSCASAIGVSAHQRWEIEEEEG